MSQYIHKHLASSCVLLYMHVHKVFRPFSKPYQYMYALSSSHLHVHSPRAPIHWTTHRYLLWRVIFEFLLKLPTNDIVYDAFLNSSASRKLCPLPIIGWRQRLKSCGLISVSTHLDMKPGETLKLDSLFAWHDATELCVSHVLL